MRVLPVLDLKSGVVVRGVAGRRQEYRPVVSRLTASSRPLDVAQAFRDHFGLTELYLADLDAIAGAPPSLDLYSALHADGFRLRLDAGVKEASDVSPLASAKVERIVVGLETVAGPVVLEDLCQSFDERIVFSVDLKEGVPLGDLTGWGSTDAWAIAERAIAAGVRRIIILDLACVGLGQGPSGEALCVKMASTYPDVEVISGGGVRDLTDLQRLQNWGVRTALVASALHDGRLTRQDLDSLAQPPFTRG